MIQQNTSKFYKIGFLLLLYYISNVHSNETSSVDPSPDYLTTFSLNNSTNDFDSSTTNDATEKLENISDVTAAASISMQLHHTTTEISPIQSTLTNANLCTKYSQINDEKDFIETIDGDILITFITNEQDSALPFIGERINGLGLIYYNISLGLRIIRIDNNARIKDILQKEEEYLTECVEHHLGILIAQSLWLEVEPFAKQIGSNIWPVPSTDDQVYAKSAHLLYELPWSNTNTSTELKTDKISTFHRFLTVAKHEHLCLESFNSSETLNIYVGNNLTSSFFNPNETNVVILSGNDEIFISDLPDKSFIITENEIEILDQNYSQSFDRRLNKFLGSNLISTGSILLEMVDFINKIFMSNDDDSNILTSSADDLKNGIASWEYNAEIPAHQVISRLKLENYSNLMNFELIQKYRVMLNESEDAIKFKKIASSNIVSNLTTVYHIKESNENGHPMSKLGHIFYCSREYELRHFDSGINHYRPVFYGHDVYEMYWQFKQETWVAAGLTISALGILLCLAILTFLVIRICMDDVLEGNPTCSILLLISLIFQFASFFLFTIEYTSYRNEMIHRATTVHIWNLMCSFKIFLVSVCYCTTFSVLLCRAIMLASIGSEGGFLSHVNGYLQSVICVFSTLVQLGLSSQLMIIFHATSRSISCNEIYYGNMFWGIVAYDGLLLITLVFLSPTIFKSQRNYREGILLVTGSILCLIVWAIWIPMSMLGYEWREAAIPLGMQGTAMAVLIGILIPRCFLMVRSIARADLVQALPSLTSLAFASANNYVSEQSIYECVNPAMRTQRTHTDETFVDHTPDEFYPSPSEIPTLPMRGVRRPQILQNLSLNNNNNYTYTNSIMADLNSPSKITRF